jgi:quercetin dioxygenase-like cupin family protein
MDTSTEVRARACVRKRIHCIAQPASGDAKDLHRAQHTGVIDYKLQEITNNNVRAVGAVRGFCADKPGMTSPWHYHNCDMQIGVVLHGSVEMAFAADGFARIGKHDVSMIPGGTPHDVSEPSSDYTGVEFTFPGDFGTTETLAPPRGTPSVAVNWGLNDATRVGAERGLVFYRYPVSAPYNARYAIHRQRRVRIGAFTPGSLMHDHELSLLYVTQGTRTIMLYGDQIVLETGDLLVLPGGVACEDIGAADEHEAICIDLLRG